MCDRTKTEVLARELAIQRFIGFRQGTMEAKPFEGSVETYVEQHWKMWENAAKDILEILEHHKP
jgi:hypothetical protein